MWKWWQEQDNPCYECLVYPMDLLYGLNYSPCFTEWIGFKTLSWYRPVTLRYILWAYVRSSLCISFQTKPFEH